MKTIATRLLGPVEASPRCRLRFLVVPAIIALLMLVPFGVVEGYVGHADLAHPHSSVLELTISDHGSVMGRVGFFLTPYFRDLGPGLPEPIADEAILEGWLTADENVAETARYAAWKASLTAAGVADALCGGPTVFIPPGPNETGGSAGLPRALAAIDVKTNGALLSGRLVAATGRVSPSGSVGEVSGLAAKVAAAKRAGASLFIAPAEIEHLVAPVAREHGIELLAVSSVAEAVEHLAPGLCS